MFSSSAVYCRLFDANTGLRNEDDDDDAALAEPLLTIPHAEDECCEDGEGANENIQNHQPSSCWDTDPDRISLLVLPLLLCLQFALALHYSCTTTAWEVSTGICLFVVISFLYKECLKDDDCEEDEYEEDHNPASSSSSSNHRSLLARLPSPMQHVLHLLPEIVVDVVLGLVLFGSVDAGIRALFVSILILSLIVVVSTMRHIMWTAAHDGNSSTSQQHDQDTEEQDQTDHYE